MTGRLRGKTALITGASRGIGRAIADAYAAEGANLVLNARDATKLAAVAREIAQTYGVAVHTAACDVTDRDAVFAAVAGLQGLAVDVLVNNAGVHKARRFLDYTFEEFREVLETNVYGVLHITQAVLPGMIERKGGRIVNLASTAGKWGSRNQSAYNASKHAVVGLTRCLGLEMAPHNILVNAICPWVVDTDMAVGFIGEHAAVNGVSPEQMLEAFKGTVPIKRMIKPQEVAAVAVFLASEESSYVNGQTWAVDGGYTMI
jgi:meso-butanediol dehydrogenase/(S,S)-butanediol dehydrogenase/diacetyl reductase